MRMLVVAVIAVACSDSKPKPPDPAAEAVEKPRAAADAAGAETRYYADILPAELDFGRLERRAAGYHEPPAVSLVPYRDKDWWGYADRSGKVVIPAKYESVKMFKSGRGRVSLGKSCGIVDATGYLVVEVSYERCEIGDDGSLAVSAHDSTIILDRTGKPVTREYYDNTFPYVASDGMIGVVRRGRVGFVSAGKLRIDYQFDGHNKPREGRIPVVKDRRWGVVDYDGKVVVPFEYDSIQALFHGLALAQKGNKWGAIDRDGKVVIPFDYELILGNAEPDYLVAQKVLDKAPATILDRTGKVVATLPWVAHDAYGDGLIPVEVNHKIGYADIKGRLVIPARFASAADFHGGLAWAANDRLGGFIDKTGNYVIPPRYAPLYDYVFMIDGITDVGAGMAGARPPEDDLRLFIDTTGREYISADTRAWFAKRQKP